MRHLTTGVTGLIPYQVHKHILVDQGGEQRVSLKMQDTTDHCRMLLNCRTLVQRDHNSRSSGADNSNDI